jgi:hypothetical protein
MHNRILGWPQSFSTFESAPRSAFSNTPAAAGWRRGLTGTACPASALSRLTKNFSSFLLRRGASRRLFRPGRELETWLGSSIV